MINDETNKIFFNCLRIISKSNSEVRLKMNDMNYDSRYYLLTIDGLYLSVFKEFMR